MSTDSTSGPRRWRRGLAAVAVTTATMAAPLALLAQPGGADISGVSDAGMTLLAAQATLTSSGSTSITYRSSATVTPGKDTLLQAQFYNDGVTPVLSATMT